MALKLSTALVNALCDTAPLKTAMNLCFIDIYSGVQPANANAAATGTRLCTISNNSGATGLTFEAVAVDGFLEKETTETWSGTAANSGTAGWFRMRLAGDAGGLDVSTYKRVDGSIATSGGQLNAGSLTVTAGAPFVLTAGGLTLPKA